MYVCGVDHQRDRVLRSHVAGTLIIYANGLMWYVSVTCHVCRRQIKNGTTKTYMIAKVPIR